MLVVQGYAADVRLLRAILLFKLGFWAGTFASASLLKRAFPSRGDADSDELRLVAILDGIELKSRAQAFRGGSMFTWLGGMRSSSSARSSAASRFGCLRVGASSRTCGRSPAARRSTCPSLTIRTHPP